MDRSHCQSGCGFCRPATDTGADQSGGTGAQPKQLLTRISLWIVLYALIQIVLKLAAMKSQLLSQMFRIHELARVTQALQSCDYQRLEQEDYQQTKALAFATVQQDSSLTQIFPSNLKRFWSSS